VIAVLRLDIKTSNSVTIGRRKKVVKLETLKIQTEGNNGTMNYTICHMRQQQTNNNKTHRGALFHGGRILVDSTFSQSIHTTLTHAFYTEEATEPFFPISISLFVVHR
jgi:hypothetical protein